MKKKKQDNQLEKPSVNPHKQFLPARLPPQRLQVHIFQLYIHRPDSNPSHSLGLRSGGFSSTVTNAIT